MRDVRATQVPFDETGISEMDKRLREENISILRRFTPGIVKESYLVNEERGRKRKQNGVFCFVDFKKLFRRR